MLFSMVFTTSVGDGILLRPPACHEIEGGAQFLAGVFLDVFHHVGQMFDQLAFSRVGIPGAYEFDDVSVKREGVACLREARGKPR